MKDFRIIVITPPEIRSDEPELITRLLEECADIVHLRHPGCSIDEMCRLVESIPEEFRSRLRVHSHFSLVDEYGLRGPHLNGRCPEYHGATGSLSRSCHSVEEIPESGYEYVTLSPVFDSISKSGYHSKFDISDIRGKIAGKNVIALGGVTPEMFSELKRAGFTGAAMLGYIWNAPAEEITDRITNIKNKLICCNL